MRSRYALKGLAAVMTVSALALTGCGDITTTANHAVGSATGTHENGLPKTTVWSTYGIGTSVYAEQASVAEVLISDYDTQVRMVGSNTAMGRVTPLRTGQAQVGRLSDEAFYAFEAKYEFVAPDWGPQDLRTIWTPPTTVTVGVPKSSGVTSLQELKGKRVPLMTASPSAHEKVLGILSYAGLERDDVKWVPVEYSKQPELMQNGGLDMVLFGTESPALLEVATQVPFRWLDFDGDAAAEQRLQEWAPSVTIEDYESPIGMEGNETLGGPTYAIQMTTYADYSADEVYALVKAFHEAFPTYENATATNRFWKLEDIDWMPTVLPHHEGLVRYLKEQGVWTDEHEKRNQLLIERGEKLRAGWPEVLENTPADSLEETWDAWKDEHAPHPPLER